MYYLHFQITSFLCGASTALYFFFKFSLGQNTFTYIVIRARLTHLFSKQVQVMCICSSTLSGPKRYSNKSGSHAALTEADFECFLLGWSRTCELM